MSAVLDAVRLHAERAPGALALVEGERRWSYADLQRDVEETAWTLHALLRDGPGCVAVALPNGAAWVLVDLALMRLNRAALPLPGFFTPAQIDGALADAGADWLIAEDGVGASLPIAGRTVRLQRRNGRADRLHLGTAKVTYTSGSTGTPKGVCLSLAGMEQVAASIVARFGAQFAGVHAPLLPLGVLLENVAGLYAVLLAGGAYHVEPLSRLGCANPFRPDFGQMGDTLTRAGATSLIVVPELLRGIMAARAFGAMTLPALNLVAVGGAKVAPELLGMARSLNLPVFEGYGLTECASVVAVNAPGAERAGSVGRPLDHVRVAIDATGDVVVRDATFLGYAGQAAHRGEVRTGDRGEIDDDGFLYVTGRQGNVIITSFGRNVSPEWVESELLAEPVIRHAIVFGEGRSELRALIAPVFPGLDRAQVGASVERANARLPAYARIGAFELMAPLTAEAGLLTGNGRPRRQAILAAHGDFVNGQDT